MRARVARLAGGHTPGVVREPSFAEVDVVVAARRHHRHARRERLEHPPERVPPPRVPVSVREVASEEDDAAAAAAAAAGSAVLLSSEEEARVRLGDRGLPEVGGEAEGERVRRRAVRRVGRHREREIARVSRHAVAVARARPQVVQRHAVDRRRVVVHLRVVVRAEAVRERLRLHVVGEAAARRAVVRPRRRVLQREQMVLRHARRAHRRVREPLVDVDELRVRGGRADRAAAAAAALAPPLDRRRALLRRRERHDHFSWTAEREVHLLGARRAARRPAGVGEHCRWSRSRVGIVGEHCCC